MRDQLRGALGLVAIVAALLSSGCGSSGTSSTSTHANASAATATKAQFVAQAQGICRTLSTQEKPLKARQESLKKLPTAEADKAFVALVRQLVAFSKAASSKLQLLPQPPGDARAIEKLLSSFSVETRDAAAIAAAATKQESDPGEAAQDALRRSIAQSRALAAVYGMQDCIGSE